MAHWEHPNVLTWEKREKSKVLASVTVSKDGSAMAMAVVNGQKERRSFPDAFPAKVWCDAMLNPTEALGAPLDEAPSSEDPPVERLIRFLHNDPDLAWVIANRVKALGPWVSVGDWRQRADGNEFVVATVRFLEHGWVWNDFTSTSGNIEAIAEQNYFASEEEAKKSCDVHLRSKGWLLATKPMETKCQTVSEATITTEATLSGIL